MSPPPRTSSAAAAAVDGRARSRRRGGRLSPEQRRLVAARFRKGVDLADFVPTFMACERVPLDDGGDDDGDGGDGGTGAGGGAAQSEPAARRYRAPARSRRRAEWHGDAARDDPARRRAAGGGRQDRDRDRDRDREARASDADAFVPWRAVFTERSLRAAHAGEWRSALGAGAGDGDGGDDGGGGGGGGGGYHATCVSEYVPTGALLEARFFRAPRAGADDGRADGSRRARATATEYRLLEGEAEVAAWWAAHGRFASHEQFFPRGLRLAQLPDTLRAEGWETKMQRTYGR